QVLGRERRRPALGDRLEAPPRRRERLRDRAAGVPAQAHQRAQLPQHPLRLLRVVDQADDDGRELRVRLRLAVAFEDAGLGLDHLLHRPERHAVAVGQGPALPYGDGVTYWAVEDRKSTR